MPYSITYGEDDGVITTYTGVLTDDEMLRSARARFVPIEKTDSYHYVLSDFTDVSNFDITPEGVRAAARIADLVIERNAQLRMAMVLPTDLEYGMGRMWQILTSEGDEKIRIVRTMPEAMKWVKSCQ